MEILKKTDCIENNMISASFRTITSDYTAHQHEFFEIEYVISGSGYCIIDGMRYPIRENVLFFMTPANIHAVETDNAHIINLMFPYNLSSTNSLYSLVVQNNSPSYELTPKDGQLIYSLLLEIIDAVNTEKYEYAIHFLSPVVRKLASLSNTNEPKPISYITRALLFIVEKFNTHISLNDVASHVGLSSSYLSMLFQQQTGENFKTYLNNMRFDYATKLLTFSDLSIQEVCIQSGFQDYPNFTRQFKKIYGETPNSYRVTSRR